MRVANIEASPSTWGKELAVLQQYDKRNADVVYSVNGVLRHRDEPGLSPFDSVVQGDSIEARFSACTSTWPGCIDRPKLSVSPPFRPRRRSSRH
jgi:hypothetical protein